MLTHAITAQPVLEFAEDVRAGLTKPQGLGEVLKMVGLSDDIAGHLQQDSTAVRERDLPTRSLEQLHAERPLKPDDLLAQRRLSHVQRLGGAAEVEVLRNCDEVPQLAKLHPTETTGISLTMK